jgi:hypothetical protein
VMDAGVGPGGDAAALEVGAVMQLLSMTPLLLLLLTLLLSLAVQEWLLLQQQWQMGSCSNTEE